MNTSSNPGEQKRKMKDNSNIKKNVQNKPVKIEIS